MPVIPYHSHDGVTGYSPVQSDLFGTDDGVTGCPVSSIRSNCRGNDRVSGCSSNPTEMSGTNAQVAPVITSADDFNLPNTLSPRHRYGCPPDVDIPLESYRPRLSADYGALLTNHVMRQAGGGPGPLLDWVMRQANRYYEAFPTWSFQDQDHAAALDLLIWQRAEKIKSTNRWDATKEIIELLEGLEEEPV